MALSTVQPLILLLVRRAPAVGAAQRALRTYRRVEGAAPRAEPLPPALPLEVTDMTNRQFRASGAARRVRRFAAAHGLWGGVVDAFTPAFRLTARWDATAEQQERDGAAAGAALCGNELAASQTAAPPRVAFNSREGTSWALALLSPDLPLLLHGDADAAGRIGSSGDARDAPLPVFVHWLLVNIPGGHPAAVHDALVAAPYVPPLPARDAPRLRCVFLLVEQDAPVEEAAARAAAATDVGRTLGDARSLLVALGAQPKGLSYFSAVYDDAAPELYRSALGREMPVVLTPDELARQVVHAPRPGYYHHLLGKHTTVPEPVVRTAHDVREETLARERGDLPPPRTYNTKKYRPRR